MSFTVPSNVKPSGGLVLPAIPSQPQKAAKQPTAQGAAPAIEQARLVPARVGRTGHVQTVYIECPTWCVVDHMDRQTCLEDVMHYSDADVLQVSTLTDDDTSHSEMYANISSDPTATDPRLRAAHLVINDGAPDDAYLTPDMADELADEMIAFAAQLRHKARQVRLYNKAGR
jgi:hypothetical protein